MNAFLLYVKGKVALPTAELVSSSISEHGIGLIRNLLVPEPIKRVTAEVVLRSLWLEATKPLELAASNQQGLVYLAQQDKMMKLERDKMKIDKDKKIKLERDKKMNIYKDEKRKLERDEKMKLDRFDMKKFTAKLTKGEVVSR